MNTPRRPRTCEVCDQQYVPTYYKQRTCGRICGAAINTRLAAARSRAKSSAVVWKSCTSCAKPYTTKGMRRCPCARVYGRSPDWRQDQPCVGCGTVMSLHRHNLRRLRCDACLLGERRRNKDKRRAMKRAAYRADVRPSLIYERDGYRCKLCGKRLNMKAAVPHPMAPTIDHIVPLAQGGTHEPANAQAAHFLCNSIKGDRGGNEQLLLIG